MADPPLQHVVVHWHKLFSSLEASSQEFYQDVERTLAARQLPVLRLSRIRWSEGGIHLPDREYLRVTGDRHIFDICAAPFGTGFFFSSWVSRRQARFVPLYLLGCAVVTLVFAWLLASAIDLFGRTYHGPFFPIFGLLRFVYLGSVPLAGLAVLWLIAAASRSGNNGPELAILKVPGLGWLYAKLFASETFYRIDTMLMFQAAVHSAMLEAIDRVTSQKGLRTLADDERKPIFREFQ